MGNRFSAAFSKTWTAMLLASVVLFGHLNLASAEVMCHQIFPAKVSVWGKLLTHIKAHRKVKTFDIQTRIRILESSGYHEPARALRAELAETLKTAPMIVVAPMSDGVNGAKLAMFGEHAAGVVKKAVRFVQSPGAEVAAYELNMFFDDFVKVPVTVLRQENGLTISVQAFLRNARDNYNGGKLPPSYRYRIRFFDILIDNPDRHDSNIMIDSEGFFESIDNGIAFRSKVALEPGAAEHMGPSTKDTAWSLMFRNWFSVDKSRSAINLQKAREYIIAKALPERRYYDKLKSTPDSVFEEMLSPYVSPEDVAAFIRRKNFYIETVEDWMARGNRYPRVREI